jgi:hypothetical protein
MWAGVLAIALGTGGCVAAAAGAGAAGGIYVTNNGVQGSVNGPLTVADARTRHAFEALNIQLSSVDDLDNAEKRTLHGKMGDKDVTVKLNRVADSQTTAEVSVKSNVVAHDNDTAKVILERIVESK